MKQQKLPSDRLKATRRWPWIVGLVGALAIAASAVAFGPALASQLNPTAVPTPTMTPYVSTLTPAELDSVQQGADEQAAIIKDDEEKAAAAAAAVAAALAAAHQQQVADGPIKCAAGYTANAVDAAGNESNCQKDGPGGRPCVAYNDANQCTAYLEP